MHEVGSQGLEHTPVFNVLDVGLSASLFHKTAYLGIMHVADSRKKMVLNLEVQPAQQPVKYSAARSKIRG